MLMYFSFSAQPPNSHIPLLETSAMYSDAEKKYLFFVGRTFGIKPRYPVGMLLPSVSH